MTLSEVLQPSSQLLKRGASDVCLVHLTIFYCGCLVHQPDGCVRLFSIAITKTFEAGYFMKKKDVLGYYSFKD